MDYLIPESNLSKLLAGTAIALALPYLYKVLREYLAKNRSNKVPKAKHVYPNEIDFSVKEVNDKFNENYEQFLIEWCEKYPNGCTISLSETNKILVLNSVDAVREYSKNDAIADRPHIFLFDVISHHFQGSFFRMYDADLNEVRKTTLQGIHKLVLSNPDAETLVMDELERFFEFLERDVLKVAGDAGVLENAQIFLQQVVVNIIFQVALGIRFDYDLDKNAAVKEQIRHMSTLLTALNLAELSKVNAQNAGGATFGKTVEFLSSILGSMYNFITGAVVGYKQNSSGDDSDMRTLGDMLLKKQREELKQKLELKSGDLYSDDDIIVQVFTAFLATSGTAGFTTAWALHYISKQASVASSIKQEIEQFCGDANVVRWQQRASMSFTEAMIQETLRMSSTQANIPRATCTEVKVNGNCIPANTPIIINTFGIHHSSTNWSPDAKEFKPQRWINEDGKTLKLNNNCFMPFGTAPRTCPGDTLSKALIFSVVTNLVNRFTMEYVPVKNSDSKNSGPLGVMRCPHEFNLKLKRRN